MCRTTLPLDPKRSDGRIAYNSRENEDSLSLKKIKFEATGYFFFFSPPRFLFLCFIPSFLLFFLFLFLFHFPIIPSSHFSFFFSFIFSPFPPFSLNFSPPFWSIDRMGQKRKFPPLLPQSKCVAFHFPIFIPYFFISFMTSYPTWLNMSHGIMPPMWLNVSHSFLCQVSHTWGAMWHPLTLPCVIRHPTPRKT